MKINLKVKLLNLKGEPIIEKNEAGIDAPLILGELCTAILSYATKDQHRSYMMAQKIQDVLDSKEEEIDLKAEDVVFLKNSIESANSSRNIPISALIVGQCIQLIDKPREAKGKGKKGSKDAEEDGDE